MRHESAASYDSGIRAFLEDEAGLLPSLVSACERLGGEHDLAEIFRLVHTIKGNASVFGLEAITSYAHLLEQAFLFRRGKWLPADPKKQKQLRAFLQGFCGEIDKLFASYRQHPEMHPAVDELLDRTAKALERLKRRGAILIDEPPKPSSANQPALRVVDAAKPSCYLRVSLNGQELAFSCDSIIEVLWQPRLFPVPRLQTAVSGPDEVKGLVRASIGLVPYYDPRAGSAADDVKCSGWAVVLRAKLSGSEDFRTYALGVDEVGGVVGVPF